MKLKHIRRIDGTLTLHHKGHTYAITGEVDGGASVVVTNGGKVVQRYRAFRLDSALRFIQDYAELA